MRKLILTLVVAGLVAFGDTAAFAASGTLKVEGLCGMCKTRIEKAAKGVDGVTSAAWNKDTKELSLEYDSAKVKLAAVSKALAAVGHDTEADKADDKVYDALPGCCKYRGKQASSQQQQQHHH
ncbi:MAG: cation transporter [Acidobacteriota bacterium]|jgi:copper chaperone CopZ|nr:cation transporter [Acidobacteriota bacterium]